MSEIITKGYLIARNDYQMFDEIITFINEFGNKFVCLAQGTKKIESHNARHMQLGNYCEFQFFLARNEDKVSKLMKINALEKVEWPNFRQSLITLNSLTEQLVYPNVNNYKFYVKMRPYAIDKTFNDAKAELIVLRNYCKLTGIDLHVNDCVICHNHHIKTISFQKHGLLCGQCFDQLGGHEFSLEFSKLVYHLFKDEYGKMDKYEDHYIPLITHLKQYITDNNGTYFARKKKRVI